MKFVLISDTHGYHDGMAVPDGDVLIHAGDLTRGGSLEEVREFNTWLGTLPHRHKIIIAGNHDWCFEEDPKSARKAVTHATYLADESVEIEGLKFWGSPWQPRFLDWAFNVDRGPSIAEKWARIPDDTDILITHGPPHGILDLVGSESVGCEDLLKRVQQVRPQLHVFGHIHETPGIEVLGEITFVNAATDFARGPAFEVEL